MYFRDCRRLNILIFIKYLLLVTAFLISSIATVNADTDTNPNNEQNVTKPVEGHQLPMHSFLGPNSTFCEMYRMARRTDPWITLLCSQHQHNKPSEQTRSDLGNCTRLAPPPDIHSENGYFSNSNTSSRSIHPPAEDELNVIMNQGMSILDTRTHSKSVILILGNTGSGKTTITQMIAGNLSRLHGVMTSSDNLVVIDEDDRIGAPSIKSKTIYPEYVTNPLTNDSFYDCPGFDDNRGAGTDIAAMFSLKSIVDSVHHVKFLFTVPHSSVRIGNDRLDFDLLTRHAARFLKNMSNMRESIGLIVTKVNSFSSSFGNYLSDDNILGGIVEFLLKFRQTLHERLTLEIGDKSEIHRKIQFIEAILKRDGNEGPYERIWFVRDPPKCGPFSEIPYASQVRQKITDLLQNTLSFAHVNSSDFGITLKDATLLKVEQRFIPEIKIKLENETTELVHKLKNEFLGKLNSSLEMDDDDTRRGAILKLKAVCDSFSQMKNVSLSSAPLISQTVPEIVKQFRGNNVGDTVNVKEILRAEQLLSFFQFLTNKPAKHSFLALILTELRHDLNQVREITWNRIQNEFVGDLHMKIADEFNSLTTHLETLYLHHIQHEMAKRNKINSTLNSIRSQYSVLRRLSSTSISQEELVDQLYSSLGFEVDPRHIRKLNEIENMYSFYEQMTNAPILRGTNTLTTGISQLTAKINDVGHWYGFVRRVDSVLSKYNAQVILRDVSKEMLQDYGDDFTFLEEFHLISSIPTLVRNISRDGRVKERMKQQLHEVILSALTQKATFACENEGKKVVIKGRFVKFSDFLTDNDEFTFPCKNGNLTELQIFASETVFIDKDILARGKDLYLSILAPKWEVVVQSHVGRKRLISLDGSHGASFENNPRANSGDDYGNSGRAGEPGKPAGNGGAFFGIYDDLVNGHLFWISVDGGDGGEGQHGGHGYSGRDGRDAERSEYPNPYMLGSDISEEFETHGLVVAVLYNHRWFVKLGKGGRAGGNGGDGGVGGIGGNPGFITIHSVNNSGIQSRSGIEMSKNIGHVGSPGEGGLGGIGGKNGDKFKCALRSATVALWWDSCGPVPVDERADNGTDGVEGGNPLGQVFPGQPSPPTTQWKVIADYKGFMLESESDAGIKFIRKIESNSNITDSYVKPVAFAQELFNLEKLFHKNTAVPISIDLLQEYKLLLGRIQVYLKRNHSDLSYSNKKVLNYLCASIISKISAMRQKNGEPSLIVNLSGFLSAISEDMKKLKEGQVNVVISERKQKMYDKLRKKKRHAESFIQSAVIPSIAQTSAFMDQTINKVVEEINLNIRNGLTNIHQHEIDQRRFESALVGQKVLQGFQICGTVLELFGVKSAGSVAKLANVFNKQYISPIVNSQPGPATTLPTAFAPPKNSLKSMENDKYFLQVSQSIPIQEALISKQIAKHPLYLEGGDIPTKLSHLQQAFQHLNLTMKTEYSSDIDIIEAREKLETAQSELMSACKWKMNELSRRKDRESLRTKLSLSMITPALSLANANPALYAALKPAPQNQRQHFATKLKEAQQSLKNIENRKRSIYRAFIPIMKSAFTKIHTTSAQLQQSSTSSTATLIVTKWEILQMLKTVKVELKEFVKGLQVEEQVTLCLDKLEQSFSLLIEVYEKMDEYEEQKELVGFIADVNSPNLLITQLDDDDDDAEELAALLTKMELLLRSNLFLWDYEHARNAFKQWVFPFATNYLHHEDLTADAITKMLLDGASQDIAQVSELYLNRVERLRTAMDKYNTMTANGDDILIKSYFSSESQSSQPFYVWRNEEWEHSIRELLSGKTVNLRAQVWKNGEDKVGGRRRSAIKFKTIELFFKHKNSSAQPELDNALTKYLLTMTHSGISYYRVLSDVVVMKGANQTTRYSFEKRCSGDVSGSNHANLGSSICSTVQHSGRNLGGRVAGNVVYSKFQDQNSDYLLSPYTMWTFELIDIQNSKEEADFRILETYATELDLELRGEGMYIDEDLAGDDTLKDLNISTYYQIDSSYFQDFRR